MASEMAKRNIRSFHLNATKVITLANHKQATQQTNQNSYQTHVTGAKRGNDSY